MAMRTINGHLPEYWKYSWKTGYKEIVTVELGEEFRVDVPDSSSLQIKENWNSSDIPKIDWNKVDSITGPIKVEGINRGETAKIEIVDIKTGKWGWSAIMNDFGLLKNQYDPTLVIWDIYEKFAVPRNNFLRGVLVPIRPMLGIVGAMPDAGEFPVIPPQVFGGNLDNKYLGKGSAIHLTSKSDGLMFAISDTHAAQGNGEVCGTGIETSASVTLRVVKSDISFDFPVIESRAKEDEEIMVFTGISTDLHEAAKLSVENFINTAKKLGLDGREAYVLASVAGDLEISEVVDEPNLEVSLKVPRNFLYQLK